MPLFSSLVVVLFLIMYGYAQVGVAFFGGRIFLLTDPDGVVLEASPSVTTDFGSAGYYAINFNDFTSAMLFLFQLLIVNNWQIFMQALVEVTDEWAHIFCISWFILGVLVMFNLVVAQVLGVFLDEVGESKRRCASVPLSSSAHCCRLIENV